MSKEPKPGKFELDAEVIRPMKGKLVLLRLPNGHECLGYLSGRMFTNKIRCLPGDIVIAEMDVNDFSRCRIVYRYRDSERPVPTQATAAEYSVRASASRPMRRAD